MSTFEDHHYRWRETYFVLFAADRRPKLETVAKTIQKLNPRYQLSKLIADQRGLIESLTVVSPEDYAALDICFTSGEEVCEQAAEFVKDLKQCVCDSVAKIPLKKILDFDSRFDVLHFERVVESEPDEEDEMLDPSALLIVLDALAKLTDGAAIDPQSGTMLENDD